MTRPKGKAKRNKSKSNSQPSTSKFTSSVLETKQSTNMPKQSSPQYKQSSTKSKQNSPNLRKRSSPRTNAAIESTPTPSKIISTPSTSGTFGESHVSSVSSRISDDARGKAKKHQTTNKRKTYVPKRLSKTATGKLTTKNLKGYYLGKKFITISDKTLEEMRNLARMTTFLIPRLPFAKLIKELLQGYGDFRIQTTALEALQTASELFLNQLFEDTNMCAMHARRVTILPRDMYLVYHFLKIDTD